MDNEDTKNNVYDAIKVLQEKYKKPKKPNTISIPIPDGYYDPNTTFNIRFEATNKDGMDTIIPPENIIKSIKLKYKGHII